MHISKHSDGLIASPKPLNTVHWVSSLHTNCSVLPDEPSFLHCSNSLPGIALLCASPLTGVAKDLNLPVKVTTLTNGAWDWHFRDIKACKTPTIRCHCVGHVFLRKTKKRLLWVLSNQDFVHRGKELESLFLIANTYHAFKLFSLLGNRLHCLDRFLSSPFLSRRQCGPPGP